MSMPIPLIMAATAVFIIGLSQAWIGNWWGWLIMAGSGAVIGWQAWVIFVKRTR